MLFLSGLAATRLSGSLGGIVASHNRGGAYFRNRSTPPINDTPAAQATKSRLANVSALWKTLTDDEKQSWYTYVGHNPKINRIGMAHVIQANATFVGINSRLLQASESAITLPPAVPVPTPLTTIALEADIGAGDAELNFTPTPLGTTEALWFEAAIVESSGIRYVENLFRVCSIEAAATASPFAYQTAVEAVLGTLQVGQVLHIKARVFDRATGLLSEGLTASATVVSTV